MGPFASLTEPLSDMMKMDPELKSDKLKNLLGVLNVSEGALMDEKTQKKILKSGFKETNKISKELTRKRKRKKKTVKDPFGNKHTYYVYE